MSIWDQMAASFGQGTATALVWLEGVSAALLVAAVVALLVDLRRARRQKAIDEREALVARARQARGLS